MTSAIPYEQRQLGKLAKEMMNILMDITDHCLDNETTADDLQELMFALAKLQPQMEMAFIDVNKMFRNRG